MVLDGSAARRGRHVSHGYRVGLLGASRVYCDIHCCVLAESVPVVVGALAGRIVAGNLGDENERTLRTVTLMKR